MPAPRRLLAGLAALATGTALLAGAPAASATAPADHVKGSRGYADVQLLAVNDLHGNLQPPSGSSGTIAGQPAGGAAHLAGHLAALRAGHENTLTVAAGDLIGASPLISALFHDEPTIEAMNAVHLDVSAVGNHEFDEGLAELRRIADGGCHPVDGCQTGHPYAGADFPYLAANVVDASGEPVLPPYAIEEVGGVRVGFIGMTLEGTPDIVAAEGVRGLRFLDEAETANRYAEVLQSRGVQSIVVLLHEGGTQTGATPDVNACEGFTGPVVDIVDRMAPSIDAVVSAHTHQAYTCSLAGKLVTSGSSFGRLVTDIDLTISRRTKDVVRASAENVVVTRDPALADAGVQQLVDSYQALSDSVASRPVGSVAADVVRAAGPNGESPLGDVVADAQLAATAAQGAQVALMNPGGVRADLVAAPSGSEGQGVVTYGEAFTVQPFNNLLTTATYTGAQLQAVLEQQYDGGHAVLQPAGVTWTATPSAPAGSRVSAVAVAGAPLDPAATYRVTVNNFLYGGGDGFSALTAGTDPVNSGLDIDAFTAYLGAHPGLVPPAADRISLAG